MAVVDEAQGEPPAGFRGTDGEAQGVVGAVGDPHVADRERSGPLPEGVVRGVVLEHEEALEERLAGGDLA